jgi:hypothetical protein
MKNKIKEAKEEDKNTGGDVFARAMESQSTTSRA